MKKIFQIALGIVAAVGGFVDIGELVFNAQAGAHFGYKLLWAVVVCTLAVPAIKNGLFDAMSTDDAIGGSAGI